MNQKKQRKELFITHFNTRDLPEIGNYRPDNLHWLETQLWLHSRQLKVGSRTRSTKAKLQVVNVYHKSQIKELSKSRDIVTGEHRDLF